MLLAANRSVVWRRVLGLSLLVMMASALFVVSRGTTATAHAATICQDQFNVLRADTQSVTITGGKVDKERGGLLKLIDDAQALASIGKTSDAITKLQNFKTKIDQLEAAGRITSDDASRLRSEADATIACLQTSGG